VFLGCKRVVNWRKFKNKKKELATIVTLKAILQENVIRRNKIERMNSKVLHK
jgi:hypothetical protein